MRTTATRKKRPEIDDAAADAARVPSIPRSALKRGKVTAARYRIILWREDGEWYGQGVEEPGAMGDGRTMAQCVRNTRHALAIAVASHIVDHEPIVTPIVDQDRRRRAG